MPYRTDERLKSYLDTNQLHREQMCRAILAADPRFSDVRPRHPRGGPDDGRDIDAVYRGGQTAFGAVGFVNQANDSTEQKRRIAVKFSTDLSGALGETDELGAFVFFTNVNLTIGEKDQLIREAKHAGVRSCEIFDRERLRIVLDNTDGFATRFQYLDIPLSEEEQASFFARWGDEIQSVISTGFARVETALNRILFLQEVRDPLAYFTIALQLDKKYSAEEIGHFRLFCSLYLKEPKHKILSILFGSSDKSNRMRHDLARDFTEQTPGIKHGIGGGQWEQNIEADRHDASGEEAEEGKYVCVGSSSSIGRDEAEFLPISYNKDFLVRLSPGLTLRDFDDSTFLLLCNRSLALKIRALHIYSNGYKLQETAEIWIDESKFEPAIPVEFSAIELDDPWVRVRPADRTSAFHLRFFEATPTRLSTPEQVKNSLQQ